MKNHIYLYGPPGSGKSLIGKMLADKLHLPFYDLDRIIENWIGISIPQIFSSGGEEGFRRYERESLQAILDKQGGIVALGGGALLDAKNRYIVENNGPVLCLQASSETILTRLKAEPYLRPLIAGNHPEKIQDLLTNRSQHYKSFNLSIDSDGALPAEVVEEIQILLGKFLITGMGEPYPVEVKMCELTAISTEILELGIQDPVAVISDDHVASFYLEDFIDTVRKVGIDPQSYIIPAGERFKTLDTITSFWNFYLDKKLDRKSTVFALGGGVIGDLVGFSAATYLRGIKWVNIPTTILAMVDASIGGKTGADLPQGKNLIGAFYPPSAVLAFPAVLKSLQFEDLRSGIVEVVKHGIIGDSKLYHMCALGWEHVNENISAIISRAISVKARVVLNDPFERGCRAQLNLGHTLGHGIEKASDYTIRHGEAVAIGIVAAARISEKIGLAEYGLAGNIEDTFLRLGLDTRLPAAISTDAIIRAVEYDKKRVSGSIHLVLPVSIGKVEHGIKIDRITDLVDMVAI